MLISSGNSDSDPYRQIFTLRSAHPVILSSCHEINCHICFIIFYNIFIEIYSLHTTNAPFKCTYNIVKPFAVVQPLGPIHMWWVQLCGSSHILWHCSSLRLEWKLTFSRPVATAEFSKFAGILSEIECNFTASSFRTWNSSSPPLALFIVMLPKACLTLHSRMCGSRWVITPLWLSGL